MFTNCIHVSASRDTAARIAMTVFSTPAVETAAVVSEKVAGGDDGVSVKPTPGTDCTTIGGSARSPAADRLSTGR